MSTLQIYNRFCVVTLCLVTCVASPLTSFQARAGAYVFAGESNGENLITHPSGYTGTATSDVVVNVCIVPGTPNAAAMEVPTQNAIHTFNKLVTVNPNLKFGANNDIAASEVDYESTAVHELGHCIGLAHVNAATESGLAGNDRNYTKATNGVNNVWDIDPGVDGIIGNEDDVRGDDVNLHWFNISSNDPFAAPPAVVDSTTYTRDIAQLPSGNFATNADRTVGANSGYVDSEAVMQQGAFFDEDQRALLGDDVATLRLAMSGLDRVQSTADDYTLTLNYQGISSTNCDINVAFDASQTGFAVCMLGGSFIQTNPERHISITSADVFFNPSYAWYFNQKPNSCHGESITVDLNNSETPTNGNDVILGTTGADTIDALKGDDIVCGLAGNDTITGGAGEDIVYGNDGDDTISGNQHNDLIFGGEGIDTINGGGGDDEIFGEDGDDTLLGGGAADKLFGGLGDDYISAGVGADFVQGNEGNDDLYGGDGFDTIRGDDGDDFIRGGAKDDDLRGGAGIDDIGGNSGNDTLYGNAGDDTLNGGQDDDTLIGGQDTDVCTLGPTGPGDVADASCETVN